MDSAENTGPIVRARSAERARNGAFRPPWSNEIRIKQACTSCGECIRSCPEAILTAGPANTPVVDFARGACTFCQSCAEACPEPVFDLTQAPWHLKASIRQRCLLERGVACRSCTDVCEERALVFDLRQGTVGRVLVIGDACTGCGACLSMCPVNAITLDARPSGQEVRQ